MPNEQIVAIKKQIKEHKIISFDIFDTLLLRPYIRPTDLFWHMEKAYKKPFFATLRQEAEKVARTSHPHLEDVTLDMIYEELDNSFKNLKEYELNWEEMVLRANPELKQAYDYAKELGKKIVIASDMYLPTEFLAKVLRKNGFDGWDKIYVSGDIGKTKGSGNMYRQILADYKNFTPHEIIHIGDNKKSDVKKPQEIGIDSIHYIATIKQYLKQNPRIKKLIKNRFSSLGISVLVGMLVYRRITSQKSTFWQDIGYQYAGPLAYGYSRFVEEEAIKNEINNILFVARDGWLLQQVFSTFSGKIKNSYIYAPRLLNLICRLDYNPKSIRQSKAIVDIFSSSNSRIKKLSEQTTLMNAQDYHQFIQNNIELFKKDSLKFFNNYKNYLSSKTNTDDKTALVDTITCEFSSQRLVENTIQKQVKGLYWGVLKSQLQNSFEYATYTKSNDSFQGNRDIYTANWNFIEFLLTSPEYPIKNISEDGAPIYDTNPSANELWRAQTYPQIASSALDFAKDIHQLFGGNDIFITASDIISWINAYIDTPTESDIVQMSEVDCAIDSNHSEFVPLFACKTPIASFIRHPQKTLKLLKKAPWRTKLQSLLVNLAYPISCRIRGPKKVKLTLLPCLKKQYFVAAITISDNWFYKVIIGNSERI